MIHHTVEFPDFGRLNADLMRGVKLGDEIGDELREWAKDHLDGQLYGMENYAPPPPNSTYIRTGRLGANWGLQRKGKQRVMFYNMSPYASHVIGDGKGNRQAAIHAGRWWLARKRTEAAIPELERRIKARMDRVLRWR